MSYILSPTRLRKKMSGFAIFPTLYRVLGFLPLMILYILHIEEYSEIAWWNYILGIVLAIGWYVVFVRLFVAKPWESKTSPYPFSQEEMDRFDALYGKR